MKYSSFLATPAAMMLAVAMLSPLLLEGTAAAKPSYSDSEPFRIEVPYDDLNLGTAAGQKRLDARVKSAVRQACRATGRTARERSAEQQCLEEAMETAQAGVEQAIAKTRMGTDRQSLR